MEAEHGWPDHGGRTNPGAVYWTPPDPRIGRVVSAASNEGPDGLVRPTAGQDRALALTGGLVLFFAAILWIGADDIGRAPAAVVAAVVLALGSVTAWTLLRERGIRRCSYIGEDGFSEHFGGKNGRGTHRVVRFAEADGMWISAVDHVQNGLYQHTDTTFTWREEGGRTLYQRSVRTFERGLSALVAGPIGSEEGAFLAAVHDRWGRFRLARAERHLAEVGAAIFRLDGGYLTVRRQGIEIFRRQQKQTFVTGAIDRLVAADGDLRIELRSGGRVAGSLIVPIREIADFTVFLTCVQGVARIPVAVGGA